MLSIHTFVRHWAAVRPATVAMIDQGRVITYEMLDLLTRKLGAALAARGVTHGDRVIWYGKNADLYFQLLYAANWIGAIIVPVGWRLTPAEVQFIVQDVEPKIIVAEADFIEAAHAITSDKLQRVIVVAADTVRAWMTAIRAGEFEGAAPDEPVLQLYTSGTTGAPKGAVLSSRNLFCLREPAITAGVPWAKWREDEALLIGMPCAHIGGTGMGTMALGAGIPAIIQPEFSAEGTLAAIGAGVTRIFLVPAALQMVINHADAAATDFSRLAYILYGAAPMPLPLLQRAMSVIPNAGFLQYYGLTETTGAVVVLPPSDHDTARPERLRSAGRAAPGVECRIVDADGAPVAMGEVGEIVIRSDANMLGYWRRPAETAATRFPDRWLRTGDAARMDADGFIYIQDRIKDVIISGGENVYPAEVESALQGHPDLAEVAVIGVPDVKWGEAVKACVVLRAGRRLDGPAVLAWARTQIAAYKVPKSIDVVEVLPRNAAGKILRRELRAPYWADHDRQVN
ncbi:long-chain-fatty-acid--CoA ligase (plasmid) [Sphingobium sp. JS3065]|uniref:long-chain-fatty-acid--CoA ligase n=1 Tax=Sphingobium sp. JS3065 TaxID=2970925 RepID=UPI0022656ACD|nr:long-chain-fatty-acid--CoA ligase [Sphingobium sp. JS3065]UZW58265.1 long-chain-fatty-acid--CoA ligase [Sphingobium sp. JS3065]